MAQGLQRVEPDKRYFSFVGDSTFFASGLTGIVNAVYNEASLTLCILDNSTTVSYTHLDVYKRQVRKKDAITAMIKSRTRAGIPLMAEAPHPSSPEEMPTEAFSMKRSRLCPRADMWMLCPGKLFSNREKKWDRPEMCIRDRGGDIHYLDRFFQFELGMKGD